MKQFTFNIDGKSFVYDAENAPNLDYGHKAILSNYKTDVTYNLPWYKDGYTTFKTFNTKTFLNLKAHIANTLKNVIKSELQISTKGFSIEKYHKYVLNDADHYKVISKTRNLHFKDFNFNAQQLLHHFETFLGFNISNIDPKTKQPIYIIIRVNRPNSFDFNPPHKDIYHYYDIENQIPGFFNIWIPICGVNKKSALPIAPSSHLIPENEILRTREKSVLGKNTYNVRLIEKWRNSNQLQRVSINYGEALFFSSHLIHGLAVNELEDCTRVALEFRLFKSS